MNILWESAFLDWALSLALKTLNHHKKGKKSISGTGAYFRFYVSNLENLYSRPLSLINCFQGYIAVAVVINFLYSQNRNSCHLPSNSALSPMGTGFFLSSVALINYYLVNL